MKSVYTIQELKNNAKEFAQRLSELFYEFNNSNKKSDTHHSIILMNPEEVEEDGIDKSMLLSVNEGEYYVMLVDDSGNVIGLS